jgi:hypothetical protein
LSVVVGALFLVAIILLRFRSQASHGADLHLLSPSIDCCRGFSCPKRAQETNTLETPANALGIPAEALALLGGAWIFFTRGMSIQENKKAWQDLLQREN